MSTKILFQLGLVVIVCLVTVQAVPVVLNEKHADVFLKKQLYELENHKELLPRPRHTRVTCDLFSATAFGVNIKDSACALKCLIQGTKGGRCSEGVCNCRY